MIKEVLSTSKSIINSRQEYNVLAALMEEVGELSTEISIETGYSNKSQGEDGIIGEAIDVAICALDMIYVYNPCITEEEIMRVVHRKLEKWKRKQL